MDRRTRHRVMTYAPNQHGELVELRLRQAPTAAMATDLARRLTRGPVGAIAYTTDLDADGWEVGAPSVLARCGVAGLVLDVS